MVSKETVIMEQPPRFVNSKLPNCVCHCKLHNHVFHARKKHIEIDYHHFGKGYKWDLDHSRKGYKWDLDHLGCSCQLSVSRLFYQSFVKDSIYNHPNQARWSRLLTSSLEGE